MVMESGKRTEYVTPAVSRYGFRERHTEKLERRTTMAEYIDKNATVGILEAMSRSTDCECIKKRLEKAEKRVSVIPAADVAPVVLGRWVTHYRSGTPVAEGYVSTCCDMWNNHKRNY